MLNIQIYYNILTRIYSCLDIFSNFLLAEYILRHSYIQLLASQIYLDINSDHFQPLKYIQIFIQTTLSHLNIYTGS